MRFAEQRMGQRGAIVRLVQHGQLSQAEAAPELALSTRQRRRLVRRVEAAGGAAEALAYQRQHAAPNRLSVTARAGVLALAAAHPAWSAAAVWEAVEAQAVAPLPSLRTVSRWLASTRTVAVPRPPKPARRFEAPAPLVLAQMATTYGRWLVGARMA